MPELPEVETVKNQLKDKLLNLKIDDSKVYHNNIIENMDSIDFSKKIKGQTIKDITRRGKWLVLKLDDYYLISHLRMEGKYNFKDKEEVLSKHEHVVFLLSNGITMRYHDTRKFGKMHLIKKELLNESRPFTELGVEPFSNEFTKEYLKDKLKSKSIPIKTALLDQKIVVGIGNIYVDEILFLSKVRPTRKASNVSNKEIEMIIENTRETLEKAIKLGGTTIRSFSSLSVHGKFQNELLVHGKEGEPCPSCEGDILKIKVNGRGTYYCKKCQK